MKSSSALSVLLATVLIGGALTEARTAAASNDVMHINGSITVADGERAGNISTVNGSIDIGANAVIGSAHTVNGAIHLARDTTASTAATVNGAIHLGEHCHVTGNVKTVNGALELDSGATVGGSLETANGSVHLNAAYVGGRIKTGTGDIDLGPGTQVDGDVIVERNHGIQINTHMPRIVIGAGAVVKGILRFEQPVKLYVSDRATIGAVEGATAERFSGDAPP